MNTEEMRGRDLAAERVRARVAQGDVAAALGLPRSAISMIENEHTPTDSEFNVRFMDAVRALARAEEVAS